MPTNTRDASLTEKKPPAAQGPENTEELIRTRAYQFYEERGCEEGHAEEDWLKAESEILSGRAKKAAA